MNSDNPVDPGRSTDHDEYQQAWQAQTSQTRVTVDADLLLKEVQRNQQAFLATILRRDNLEIKVGLLMLPYWFYKGFTSSLPWTWWLTVPAILWVIGFILVDRIRHPQKPPEPDEPLLRCVRTSLTQIEHQIGLLRNVFWWYLMPFTVSILAFFADVAWSNSDDWQEALVAATPLFLFLLSLYAFVDYLNQRAVDTGLEPRRQELLGLLGSLTENGSPDDDAAANGPATSPVSGVLRRWLIVSVVTFVIFILLILTGGHTASSYDGPPQSIGPAGDSLAALISDQRKEKDLVGLAAMVMVDGQIEAAGAQGERKTGSGVPVEIGDRWHLGGITKSITATMVARLIEAGQLQWTTTLGEIFPEAAVHEDWHPVTLRQLLTDTAGAPANFPRDVSRNRPPLGPELTQARREAILNVMAEKPASPPGTQVAYSNVGYTIVGVIAEQVTGDTWEELVKREVFVPLGLTEAGFGPPTSEDRTLEQPRGHRTGARGKVAADDDADNTPIMGPAATIHLSLDNLCTLAREHLRGETGSGTLLSAETYRMLHKPEFNHSACGWVVAEPTAAIPHKLYWHNGTNTMWYALVVFVPETNRVIAVTANDGDFNQAEAAAWEIVKDWVTYPKTSPFAAVRWQQTLPEVNIGDEWLKVVSVDGVPAVEIVAFSRQFYGDKWQKRFEEDLVELLTRMGHRPQETVTLVVRSLTSNQTQVLEDVPLTEANRRAIKRSAQTRTKLEPGPRPTP